MPHPHMPHMHVPPLLRNANFWVLAAMVALIALLAVMAIWFGPATSTAPGGYLHYRPYY